MIQIWASSGMRPRFLAAVAVTATMTLSLCVSQANAQNEDTFNPESVTHADTIIHGGKIATNNPAQPFVEAAAIAEGHFIAVGSKSDVMEKRGEATNLIDLQGRTAIPGLNDSHLHAVRGGRFFNLELRWDGVKSIKQALEMVREQAARTPNGQWVRVIGGWSPFQFEERRLPTVEELNQAAPDTPVFVLFLYSRGFLNAAGVKALQLSEDTEPPTGSHYVFVDGGAELRAEPNPTILYKTIGALPQLSVDDQVNSTKHFYRDLALNQAFT